MALLKSLLVSSALGAGTLMLSMTVGASSARAQVVCETIPPGGAGATATGVNSLACGPTATASGENSTAAGSGALATGDG